MRSVSVARQNGEGGGDDDCHVAVEYQLGRNGVVDEERMSIRIARALESGITQRPSSEAHRARKGVEKRDEAG